jgi:hypothetical protein
MLFKMTLTPCREDQARYAVLVSYEPGPMADYGATLQAVRREWNWIQMPNGKWVWRVTRVTVLPRVPGLRGREWRREKPYQMTEARRREAVMELRRAVHVDQTVAAQEPDWDRALALKIAGEQHAELICR